MAKKRKGERRITSDYVGKEEKRGALLLFLEGFPEGQEKMHKGRRREVFSKDVVSRELEIVLHQEGRPSSYTEEN